MRQQRCSSIKKNEYKKQRDNTVTTKQESETQQILFSVGGRATAYDTITTKQERGGETRKHTESIRMRPKLF